MVGEAGSEQHTTLNSTASILVQAVIAYGLDIEAFVRALGLNPDDYDDPNGRIPVNLMQRAWALAVEWSGDPCFGLSLAKVVQPASLHGLGLAMIASDTLRESLKRVVRYQRLISTALDVQIERRAHDSVVRFGIGHLSYQPHPATIDAALAIFLQMCRITAGNPVSPLQVAINHPAPACQARFGRLFGCPVQFAAEYTNMVFDNTLLDAPLFNANPALARANDKVVLDYLAGFEARSLASRVRSELIELLPGGSPREEAVAQRLNLSLRQLQRQLQSEQTSYKRILEETRHQLAKRYLQELWRQVTEISYLLGFSEPSNFSRAFKRWTGHTPLQYRQALAAGD